MSRKYVISFLCSICILFACVSIAMATENADTVLENGSIYTINATNTIAQAVAIKDGKIVYIGNNTGAAAFKGPSTKIIDLKGKTVLPGMSDSHTHAAITIMNQLFNIDMTPAKNLEETLAIIKDYYTKNPNQEVYFGRGYSSALGNDVKGRGPKKELLDSICPDKPMILQAADGHNWWMNSVGLAYAGLTDASISTSGIINKTDDGRLWGTVANISGVPKASYNLEQYEKGLLLFQDQMHSWGYTSMGAMSGNVTKNPIEAMHSLDQKGLLKMRVDASLTVHPEDNPDTFLDNMAKIRDEYQSNLLSLTYAKFFADGAAEGGTACLSEPYANSPANAPNYGDFYWNPQTWHTVFEKAMQHGFLIHVHAIGDQAVTYTLNALEQAQANVPLKEYRNTITHIQVCKDSDLPRFAKLHVVACLNPFWHCKATDWYEPVDEVFLGKERASREYPLKRLQDAGALITSASDNPSTTDCSPFIGIEMGATRNEPGVENVDAPKTLLDANERMSVLDMVKSFTINAAYEVKREHETGSLEVGKYADMIVIDRDIFHIPLNQISATTVLDTYFNGELVYQMK